MLAIPDAVKPAGEESGTGQTGADTDLIRICEGQVERGSIVWHKLRVRLSDVLFALLRKLDGCAQVRAIQPGHSDP
jgi:hypothetical protein